MKKIAFLEISNKDCRCFFVNGPLIIHGDNLPSQLVEKDVNEDVSRRKTLKD